MSYIELKSGVVLVGLHQMMQIANAKAAVIWYQNECELTITDGVCPRKSGFHPKGRACDYRVNRFSKALQKVLREELADELGNDYDVILHGKGKSIHIHVEYDVSNPKVI